MMSEPVNQGDNARGVGKDFVPFLEGAIGCHNNGAAIDSNLHFPAWSMIAPVGGKITRNCPAGPVT